MVGSTAATSCEHIADQTLNVSTPRTVCVATYAPLPSKVHAFRGVIASARFDTSVRSPAFWGGGEGMLLQSMRRACAAHPPNRISNLAFALRHEARRSLITPRGRCSE